MQGGLYSTKDFAASQGDGRRARQLEICVPVGGGAVAHVREGCTREFGPHPFKKINKQGTFDDDMLYQLSPWSAGQAHSTAGHSPAPALY